MVAPIAMKKPYKLVDPSTRRHLILLLYSSVNNREIGYGAMHKACKRFQDMLEEKYGITLGYKFNDPSINEYWDNGFQRDIEKYAALGGLISNDNNPSLDDYYSHKLSLREPEGSLLLKTTARWNLHDRLNLSIDVVKDDIRSARVFD